MKYLTASAIVLFLGFTAVGINADLLYIWTDKAGVEHITEEPPPAGAKTNSVMEYTPESEEQVEQYEQQKQKSVENWLIERRKQEASAARKKADEAQQEALEARAKADSAAKAAREYIETHNRNQYMRRAYKYQLRKAAEDANTAREQALEAEKRAQEAGEIARRAEERLQQDLQEAGRGEQTTGQ
jgi:colicin import membrane protein